MHPILQNQETSHVQKHRIVKKSEHCRPLIVQHCLGCQQIKDCVTASRTLMLFLISAMCHKVQQQSIQPFLPHPTSCHTGKMKPQKNFLGAKTEFCQNLCCKKSFLFTFMEVEKEASGVTQHVSTVVLAFDGFQHHKLVNITNLSTSESCQHYKLVDITNLSTSQTCQHHKLVNIIYLSNTTYNMSAKESFKSEVCDCHQKCTSLLTTMTRGHCLLICVCQPFVTGNLSSPATKRSRPSIQVQEELFLDADAGDSGGDHNDHDDAQKNTPSAAHIVANTQVGQVHLGKWTSVGL